MGLKITKNTIGTGLKREGQSMQARGELAINRGLEVIRSEVVPLTPRKTSRLVYSIQGQAQQEGDDVYKVDNNGSKITGVVGTNVPYAKFVEFGTHKQEAQLYFTRGFNQSKDKVRQTIINTLKIKKCKLL